MQGEVLGQVAAPGSWHKVVGTKLHDDEIRGHSRQSEAFVNPSGEGNLQRIRTELPSAHHG